MRPTVSHRVRRAASLIVVFVPFVLSSRVVRAGEFTLSSMAFDDGATIPRGYTCDGANQSPPLQWHGAPEGTQAYVLIVDDPDAPAGTWLHWTVYDLPAESHELPRNIPGNAVLESGAKQGRNDFGKVGYGGPCPPPGKPHRYSFRLYALAKPTGLKPGADKASVQRVVGGQVLGKAQLNGTFGH